MSNKSTKKTGFNIEPIIQDWHPADVIAALHKAEWTLES